MRQMLIQHMCSVFSVQCLAVTHLFRWIQFTSIMVSKFHLFRILHLVQDYYRKNKIHTHYFGRDYQLHMNPSFEDIKNRENTYDIKH